MCALEITGAGLFVPPPLPTLQTDVAEYLLDYFRELAASGCFVPAYPSAEHHPQHASQLRAMAGAEIDAERRLQMHALLHNPFGERRIDVPHDPIINGIKKLADHLLLGSLQDIGEGCNPSTMLTAHPAKPLGGLRERMSHR